MRTKGSSESQHQHDKQMDSRKLGLEGPLLCDHGTSLLTLDLAHVAIYTPSYLL